MSVMKAFILFNFIFLHLITVGTIFAYASAPSRKVYVSTVPKKIHGSTIADLVWKLQYLKDTKGHSSTIRKKTRMISHHENPASFIGDETHNVRKRPGVTVGLSFPQQATNAWGTDVLEFPAPVTEARDVVARMFTRTGSVDVGKNEIPKFVPLDESSLHTFYSSDDYVRELGKLCRSQNRWVAYRFPSDDTDAIERSVVPGDSITSNVALSLTFTGDKKPWYKFLVDIKFKPGTKMNGKLVALPVDSGSWEIKVRVKSSTSTSYLGAVELDNNFFSSKGIYSPLVISAVKRTTDKGDVTSFKVSEYLKDLKFEGNYAKVEEFHLYVVMHMEDSYVIEEHSGRRTGIRRDE